MKTKITALTSLALYFSLRDELSVEHDLIFRDVRVVILLLKKDDCTLRIWELNRTYKAGQALHFLAGDVIRNPATLRRT